MKGRLKEQSGRCQRLGQFLQQPVVFTAGEGDGTAPDMLSDCLQQCGQHRRRSGCREGGCVCARQPGYTSTLSAAGRCPRPLRARLHPRFRLPAQPEHSPHSTSSPACYPAFVLTRLVTVLCRGRFASSSSDIQVCLPISICWQMRCLEFIGGSPCFFCRLYICWCCICSLRELYDSAP